MNRTTRHTLVAFTALLLASQAAPSLAAEPTSSAAALRAEELERQFADPPTQARLRAYWWWLNGNVTKEAITKDLEWMKRIGMGGGLVFDAGGATQGGHDPVPAGPLFGSPAWRELFKHALREADRLGLEIGLNLQSGWNLGGPMVTPDKAAKIVAWSQLPVPAPARPVRRRRPLLLRQSRPEHRPPERRRPCPGPATI
jgi:hypothetical protein